MGIGQGTNWFIDFPSSSPLGDGEKKEKHRLAEICNTYSIIHMQELYLADQIENSEALLTEIHNGMTLKPLNWSPASPLPCHLICPSNLNLLEVKKTTKFSVNLQTMGVGRKEEAHGAGDRLGMHAFTCRASGVLLTAHQPGVTDPWHLRRVSQGFSVVLGAGRDCPPGGSQSSLWPKPVMVHRDSWQWK